MSNGEGMALAKPVVPVRLADGTETTFAVTMLTLARIEDEFGSIDAMRELLAAGAEAAMFRNLGRVFGLLMQPERTADEALALLDVQQLDTYTDAMSRAFDLAFPDTDLEQAPTAGQPQTTVSLGASGTTLPPSPSAEVTEASGL
jgi:hypothetical protein